MRRILAAIYARYSSDNQRPESIEDQTKVCRTAARGAGYQVSDRHVYADYALSGASLERSALGALLADARAHQFDAVFIDDLSRLSRDNLDMLVVLRDLDCLGIPLISVADNLDSSDQDATLPIHFRGLMNQLYLLDLKKKTFRGQRGQKERGLPWASAPSGTVRALTAARTSTSVVVPGPRASRCTSSLPRRPSFVASSTSTRPGCL